MEHTVNRGAVQIAALSAAGVIVSAFGPWTVLFVQGADPVWGDPMTAPLLVGTLGLVALVLLLSGDPRGWSGLAAMGCFLVSMGMGFVAFNRFSAAVADGWIGGLHVGFTWGMFLIVAASMVGVAASFVARRWLTPAPAP